MTYPNDRSEKGLYRSRNGAIFGVCRGVANYLDFSLFWTRVITVAATFATGIWLMLGLYVLAALLMKPEPVVPFKSADDAEFYNSYMSSRTMALQRLKRTFDSLDRRIQRMESMVTAKDYDWEQRFHAE
jgi:phage shock protein C